MYPVLLDLPSYGLLIRAGHVGNWLAVVVAVWLTLRWAQRLGGIEWGRALRVTLVLAAAVLIGARIHHVINHPGMYEGRWSYAFAVWGGSFHLPGGIISLGLATPWACRRFGVPIGRYADVLAAACGVGVAVARMGCFLQSCCYGIVCEQPWCISFPAGSQPHDMHRRAGILIPGIDASLPVHPLQLYFLAAGLGITVVTLWIMRHKSFDGEAALVALVLFSFTSSALEFWRHDFYPRTYWGPLPQLTWTGLAMTAASLALLATAEILHWRQTARFRAGLLNT
jgi:phosphatidylglycerol---prolipoprotein diacylglyceryl transferase